MHCLLHADYFISARCCLMFDNMFTIDGLLRVYADLRLRRARRH